ncbi:MULTISPECIES: type II toxin-antitoxin system Phd/YefM family antitoxin [unclassified Gilliamella]|jgi:prevent-host-death family protein|uniref:type II toxin-antitoxin system Phd/YefM family antitoxin n=1 Tax=unclassified Gilliamella TaxID=2685620 RepID=UPI001C400858|nr:type II toxin-antitoxin system Phd/YefM family antitoxin [Gilliamella apicola]
MMQLSGQVKSITFLKNNTGEVMSKLAEDRQPFVITQNGEAKAVLMDVNDYDEQMHKIAMLQRLVVAAQETEQGQYRPVDEVFAEILAEDNES